MYLSREEERMLSGELGGAVAKAVEVLVRVGEALGADRLIEISHAHVSGVSYFNIGDFGLEFIEDLQKIGARFSVFTTANPYSALVNYGDTSFKEEIYVKQLKIVDTLRKMGARSFTCTPYYVRKPSVGEHLAWAESSAVLYANSVLGAATNRETGPIALLSGICGRTYFGEAHRGVPAEVEFVVEVEKPEDPSEAGAYGLLAGEFVGESVPVVRGLSNYPEYFLKEFLAAFATYSPTYLAILEGVTPNYSRVDTSRAEKIVFSRSEISKAYSDIGSCSSPLYLVGCPHLSLDELSYVLSKVGSVKRGEFWITVGESVSRHLDIEYVRSLKILPGSCAVITRLDLLGVDCVITDSAKALVYLPKLAGVKAYLVKRDALLKMVTSSE
ncbi:MAG: aconitase X catalytic domain-containing protein [Sulfolobales archaeon]|nr:aconitase X catalytic domain-containing protein [Sulfolobales archaeon]MDW8083253.1 aconitase X catalytic domain-containing protein [Sulfolobales archaeon]